MKRLDQNRKRKLTPQQYRILKEKGTEPPFSGKLLHNQEKGTYRCAGCDGMKSFSRVRGNKVLGFMLFQ